MNQDDIEQAVGLVADADTAHEDARDWYGSYGWHLSTEAAGDVTLQAVEYDWLDDEDDDAIVARLCGTDADLSRDEAESIVARARSIRDSADSICGVLDDAVAAYDSGDLVEVKRCLVDAYNQESDHGDEPATSVLAGNLLVMAERT